MTATQKKGMSRDTKRNREWVRDRREARRQREQDKLFWIKLHFVKKSARKGRKVNE